MLATLVAVCKDRDTKAELNRRSQACKVLAGTGIRIARLVEHQGIAPCNPAWKVLADSHQRASINTYARENGIPYWNCTSLCGFADRRLS
jgi:hypothetical protein